MNVLAHMRRRVSFRLLVSFDAFSPIQKTNFYNCFFFKLLFHLLGLCTSTREIHAKIVLAGDPKQLDAVTKSECAKSLGYNISWLERLCSTNLYSRNASTGQFNEMFITQLVKNYRSHPYILRVSNELFYENKLEAYAPEGNKSLLTINLIRSTLLIYFVFNSYHIFRSNKLVHQFTFLTVEAISNHLPIDKWFM